MPSPRFRTRTLALLAMLAVAAWLGASPAGAASKKYGQLLSRLPDQANVLLMVDVDALMNSPMGQAEGWRDRLTNRPTGVLGISSDVSRFVVASVVDLSTLEERAKLGMAQARGALPQLSVLAAREGGYVEEVETQKVVWTPRGLYLFAFPDNIIGFGAPTDRKLLAGWLRDTIIDPKEFAPSWADRALFRADAGSPIVLAIELKDSVAPKQAELWLRSLESVKKANLDPAILAGRLASVKSAILQFDVKASITGTLTIEFGEAIGYAGPVAKEVVLATLDGYGAHIEELQGWTPEIKGNTLTLSGRASEEAVRRFLNAVAVPNVTPEVASAGANPPASPGAAPAPSATPAPTGPTPDVALKATRAYFSSVQDILGSLKGTSRPTYSSQKLWYDRYAKQIEQLPILNVDIDLLNWGSAIARNLRSMGSGITNSVNDRNYRLAAAPNGVYVGGAYGYGWGYGYAYAESKAYDSAAMKRQGDAALATQLDANWQSMESSIADMRRKLTEKYQVEF